MLLKEYIEIHGRGTMKTLARDANVSYVTVRNSVAGMLIKRYEVARAISIATGGAVSIAELCESPEEIKVRKALTGIDE
jgi:hypothetical protein